MRTRTSLSISIALLWACGGDEHAPPDADGDADADADSDADADGDADGDGDADPTLADRLAGAWELERTTCDGAEPAAAFDGARVSVEIAAARATLAITEVRCRTNVAYTLSVDEAGSRLVGTAPEVSCEPAGCCALDPATALPDWGGTVAFDADDRFTLTTQDAASLAAVVCDGEGLDLPSVETFRREPEAPPEVDDAICTVDAFAPGRTIVHVAQGEPGADDEACDGLSPTDEGGGHCPLRDFASARVRALLDHDADGVMGTRNLTVVVHAGTYAIEPMDLQAPDPPSALRIQSDARTPGEAVVLVAAAGDDVVLDGSCPADVPTCDSPEDPGRIWEILALSGRYIRVEGLAFDDAHKRNISIGSRDTCILNDTFRGSYGSDSDSIKGYEGSRDVIVRGNEFDGGFEQAIDATSVISWLIEDNDVHGGMDRGFGFKFAARDVLVRGNRFWDLPGEALSLGGASSTHVYPEEAVRIVGEGNVATDVGGLAEVVSCRSCALRDNALDGGRLAVRIQPPDLGTSGCAGGCASSSDLELTGNRFRGLHGDDPGVDDAAPPNAFVALIDTGVTSFAAEDNLYCALPGSPELFAVGEELVDFPEWQSRTGTDATSTLASADSAACTGDF